MIDKINIATVNFKTSWGNKEENLDKIKDNLIEAAGMGAELVLFPEMALTGYDDVKETLKPEKMQSKLAETIPGVSSLELEKLIKELEIYAVIGMPEQDEKDSSIIYNAQAVFGPEGLIGSYRKMHLPPPEPRWATRGDKPFIFETPWGPIGNAICYDIYTFPEMVRYYAAKGCRLILNSTAYAYEHGPLVGPRTLEAYVLINGVYIATANLVGQDLSSTFYGGSQVLGPTEKSGELCYYAGCSFADEKAADYTICNVEIDLSLARRMQFNINPKIGTTDFRPDKYIEMYKELL
ncbi:carbon-nitrogen hydrolase family protein [Aminipila sp.]|uniref:carbon-nitrogen hydrolase family protein n=1 Tax=Aminipila sp. TaxID=2060095 RepID=UPI00289906D2|nr:carbon-nitrogen hydrolase family protein [Aminipila sp.]